MRAGALVGGGDWPDGAGVALAEAPAEQKGTSRAWDRHEWDRHEWDRHEWDRHEWDPRSPRKCQPPPVNQCS